MTLTDNEEIYILNLAHEMFSSCNSLAPSEESGVPSILHLKQRPAWAPPAPSSVHTRSSGRWYWLCHQGARLRRGTTPTC